MKSCDTINYAEDTERSPVTN